jgi:hypothetical protein
MKLSDLWLGMHICVTLRCCFSDDIPILMLWAKYHENITISKYQEKTKFFQFQIKVIILWSI